MAGIYVNRVYDSVAVDFVHWTTEPDPDIAGAAYPGPGIYGLNTSDFTVVSKSPAARNFSYKRIAPTLTITIPIDQLMLVTGGINVEGTLNIYGELDLL